MTLLRVGTSGWQYAHWRDGFYHGVPRRLELEHYCSRYSTVENNGAFYRLPERTAFASWRDRSPPDEVFAVKVSRYLTHIRRLREPEEPIGRLLEHAAGLGGKLGPLLLQLPPNLPASPHDLERTLRACAAAGVPGPAPGARVAVEPRHASWWTDEIRELLQSYDAALCWADRLSRPVTPLWRTATWGYLRLHEGRGATWPFYGRDALRSCVTRIQQAYGDCRERDVFVYFNNDPGEAALRGADEFGRIARRRGMLVSRTG